MQRRPEADGPTTSRGQARADGEERTIIENFDPGQRHYVRRKGSGGDDRREQRHYPPGVPLEIPPHTMAATAAPPESVNGVSRTSSRV